MKKTLLMLLLVIPFLSKAGGNISPADLRTLKKLMTGFFSSALQAKQDSANYYDIHLHMQPIWENRNDGIWLYVEQAMAAKTDKPYRQRVYHLYLNDDSTIISHVFTLKKPERFTGAWKNPGSYFNQLTADSLEDRKGCSIYLHKRGRKKFAGSTDRKNCESNLRGATYATSEVSILRGMMVSWDRGWDASDKQVWGATKGGYRFLKQKNH